jgi:hypothetical protein
MYQGTNDPGDRSEVYLNDGSGKFILFENNGLNKLKLVDTLPEGLINATGMSFLDYDYDGNIDLYISTWFSDYAANLANGGMGYKMKDALLKGDGKGAFTLITGNGYDNVAEPMYGVNVTDWDNDGWQDILTSPYCRSNGSLFRNMHDGKFYDMASAAGYSAQKMGGDHGQALCQWEAQPADFDNDGDMDLLQIEVHGGNDPGEGKTHISINEGPDNGYSYDWDLARLKRDAPESTTHFGDQGGTWFDIDYDTRQDVAVACMGYQDEASKTNLQGQTRLYILRQNDSMFFDDITKSLGLFENMKEGHSMEPCDYDLDGDLDLFFSHLVKDSIMSDTGLVISEHMQIELLQNEIGNKNNWIGVQLTPPAGCNKSSIGARIYVYADSLVQIQEVQAGLGHFAGQQSFTRYFGLKTYQIDSIQVRWPHKDLITSTIYNPEINTIQQINGNGTSSYLKVWSTPSPTIAFKNPYLYFGKVNVGTQSERTFTIKNTGEVELKINNMSVTGEGFTITDSKLTIPVGGSREVKVNFQPSTRKNYSGSILVKSDAINGATCYIYLNGEGFEPKPMISVSTDSLIFTSAFIDEKRETELIIYNTGELELSFNSISLIGNPEDVFSISSQPTNIPAGSSAKLKLSFIPDEIKQYTSVLSIKSNSYNEPELTIPVIGLCNGPLPEIEFDKPTIFLGSVEIGQEKNTTLVIKNIGNADLVLNKIVAENDEDQVYSISGYTENMIIKPEDSIIVDLTFKPVQAVKYNLDLVISTNVPGTPEYRVPIKASGKDPSAVDDSNTSQLYTLSPNPAANELLLTYTGDDSGRIINISIYDITGQLKMSKSVNWRTEVSIDISGLWNGCYYSRISSGDQNKIIPFIILK